MAEESPPFGPTYGKRGDSHKNLPHHDSLRELELKEARAEARKGKKLLSGDNIKSSSSGGSKSNSNNDQIMVEPTPAPAALSSSPDTSEASLLDNTSFGGGGGGGGKKEVPKKPGNIVAAADIEISPQEQLHLQDKIDPEIHRVKKKKGHRFKQFRKKPVKEDKAPRRIYFNDPPRNASFKYL